MKSFRLSPEDYDYIAGLVAKARAAPVIAINVGMPPTPQEVANGAWTVVGKKMGFDPLTALPDFTGDKYDFFAEPV